jgi:hypothetical protein
MKIILINSNELYITVFSFVYSPIFTSSPFYYALQVDAKRIECLLKQWLLERDDMSVMHSIYELNKKM